MTRGVKCLLNTFFRFYLENLDAELEGVSFMEKKESRNGGAGRGWYKLDLSAIVYPTLQRRDFSSVYRLSVLLKEEIRPEVLQQALDMTLPRFPTYKAAIRKGLFWRYLEPNDRPGPFVQAGGSSQLR
jgi:hypothetical protein